MALPVYIQDPATGVRMAVSKDGLLLVSAVAGSSQDTSPETLTRQKQLRSFLTASGGGTDLNVNGATTPVTFTYAAENNKTKWITSVRVLFNGVNLEMNGNDFRRFGAATAGGTPLTNGVTMTVTQGGIATEFFIAPIVRMGDFFNYATNYLNIVNAITAQSDFLYFDFDFDVPVVLPPGTPDNISMTIRDNLTAIDLFKVIVRGYQEVFV